MIGHKQTGSLVKSMTRSLGELVDANFPSHRIFDLSALERNTLCVPTLHGAAAVLQCGAFFDKHQCFGFGNKAIPVFTAC